MPRTRPPYSPEFRRQMVELVRAGRNPDDLAREFEPSGHSIRAWVAQAGRNEGRREEMAPALTAAERDELIRLRRRTSSCGWTRYSVKSRGLVRSGDRHAAVGLFRFMT